MSSSSQKDVKSADLIAKLNDELAANRAAQFAAKEIQVQVLINAGDSTQASDSMVINADSASTFYITAFDSTKDADSSQKTEDLRSPSFQAGNAGGFLTDAWLPPEISSKRYGDFLGGPGGFWPFDKAKAKWSVAGTVR